MAEAAEAQSGSVDERDDIGSSPADVVSRWVMELDLADKVEKSWRERAQDVQNRYRDEKQGAKLTTETYSTGTRFNILYSNVQTICPALYNQTPKPDVRRRFRDRDPLGKVISEISERALSYTMDAYDFDRFMRLSVKDQQVAGRGLTRVKYDAKFSTEKDGEGEDYDAKKHEEVCFEHVNWPDFRRGPGRTWEDVRWVAFKHLMTLEDARKKFGETADQAQLDYTPEGIDDDENKITDTFKRMVVWEIWDKDERRVIFLAPSLKERPLKTEDDPLGLSGFFPIPRPLYASDYTDSLIPVEPFRYYKDQADELDELSKRISGIIKACKARGVYDSTLQEMSKLMDSGENVLVPAENVLTLMAQGGLDKAVWIWPIEKIAVVLKYLYEQRDAVKSTIYEITGIADIMRGSSQAQETLGAQQLKAQFGGMRLNDMRNEVQRYARDIVRISLELIAENFSPDTLQIMTGVTLPTAEQKMQAQMLAQQAQMQQQPVPEQIQKALSMPTWEEALKIMREDGPREYRIDVETDSTVAGDQAQDQKNMTELLQGIGSFIQTVGPAVESGYMPLPAAKSILLSAVRRFKMGREVEDEIDKIGDGQQQQKGPDVAAQAEQAKAQTEVQVMQQKAQSETEIASQKAQADAQIASEKAQSEAQVAMFKAQAEVEAARERAAVDAELAAEELKMKYALETYRAQLDSDAKREAMRNKPEVVQ